MAGGNPMSCRGSITAVFLLLWVAAPMPGCSPAVQIDVDCSRLCLAAPGPTLPGLASLPPYAVDGAARDLSSFDAGIGLVLPDAGILSDLTTWKVTMRFNDVLAQ